MTDWLEDAVFLGWIPQRLHELYQQYGALPRADDFFAKLLEQHDAGIVPNHPPRAFDRILLARVLILRGKDPQRARTPLTEARTTLARHTLCPPEPKQEIAMLLAQLDDHP